MSSPSAAESDWRAIKLSLNVALNLTLVVGLVAWCVLILRPFLIPIVWAIILAVAFKGVFDKLVGMLGGRTKAAAILFAIVTIAIVVFPSYKVGESLVVSIRDLRTALDAGTLQAPPPPEWLQNIPLVGTRAHEAWQLASDNMQQAVVQFESQIRGFARWLLRFLAGIGGSVLQTVLALIIAAGFLTFAEPMTRMLRAVTNRIQGDVDEDFVALSAATISSVAKGVIGIAVFQAILCGAGLFVAGIPAAGLFTIVVLVAAILQIPVLLVMILPVIWGFANFSLMWAIVFAIFAVLASASDMPLKAGLLGRGTGVPTGIILLGAIGGMVSMGLIGLFLGAIVLGIGYKMFQLWLAGGKLSEVQAQNASV